MTDQRRVTRAAFVLALVAAGLALTAAAVGYARRGEIDSAPLGGGAVMLALAAGTWQASRSGSNSAPEVGAHQSPPRSAG